MPEVMTKVGQAERTAFLLKLSRSASLSENDERRLRDLGGFIQTYSSGQTIFREGDVPRHLVLIQSGWAYRQKYLQSGKRQIINVLVPGDFVEPFGILPLEMAYSIRTATSVTASLIEVERLRCAAEESLTLGRALWRDLLMSTTFMFERTVTLGSLNALERVGHLFCELYYRLSAIGHVQAAQFEMPMTQTDIADLLGLSTVHVNRCMQELRRRGMLSLSRSRARVHDIEALASASMFESPAAYLPRYNETISSTGALRG